MDIEQDGVRRQSLGGLDGARRGVGFAHYEVAPTGEQLTDGGAERRRVVDDEDAHPAVAAVRSAAEHLHPDEVPAGTPARQVAHLGLPSQREVGWPECGRQRDVPAPPDQEAERCGKNLDRPASQSPQLAGELHGLTEARGFEAHPQSIRSGSHIASWSLAHSYAGIPQLHDLPGSAE